jgi:hypothetical protein
MPDATDQIITFVPCSRRCCFPSLEFFALHNPPIITLVETLQQLKQHVAIRLQKFPVRQERIQAVLRTEEMELIKHTVEDMKWPKGSVRNYTESWPFFKRPSFISKLQELLHGMITTGLCEWQRKWNGWDSRTVSLNVFDLDWSY